MRMPFKDYVELLYRAYLEDEEMIQRLREKLQDADYLKRLDGDPDFQDWNQVNPRDIDPRKRSRSKYHPHLLDLQQGVRVLLVIFKIILPPLFNYFSNLVHCFIFAGFKDPHALLQVE